MQLLSYFPCIGGTALEALLWTVLSPPMTKTFAPGWTFHRTAELTTEEAGRLLSFMQRTNPVFLGGLLCSFLDSSAFFEGDLHQFGILLCFGPH